MNSFPLPLAIQERRFQAVVVGGLVTVFAIVALSPHTERALFEEGRIPAAFAAVAPGPAVYPTLRRFGRMAPNAFARAFRTGRPSDTPPVARQAALPGLFSDFIDEPNLAAPNTAGTPVLFSDASSLTPGNGASGFQPAVFTPGAPGGIGSGAGPAATPTTPDPTATATPAPEPTTTPAPVPTATPAPVPTTTPSPVPTDTPIPVPTPMPVPPTIPDPVTPVPEPASWMMLLMGMALVGVVTRRARNRRATMTADA